MKKKSLIIFDMDGVLVNVSGSYREVVRLSVVYYLRYVIGAKDLEDNFIDLSDIAAIKKSGGLNNDWDLTYTILDTLLFSLFHAGNERMEKTFMSLKDIKDDSALLERIFGYRMELYTSGLVQGLGSKGPGTGKTVKELFYELKPSLRAHSPFLLNRGDVGTGNLAKRIFQELYLGSRMFTEVTGMKPFFHKGRGYMDRETLIPSITQLSTLAAENTLSIATGRPGVEAMHALGHFGINGLFAAVVTEDDVLDAERLGKKKLRKPDPFTLNLCVERSGWRGAGGKNKVYYIGDMPDDMSAAVNADITPVGFVDLGTASGEGAAEEYRGLLEGRGAEKVAGSFSELLNYFNS
jgi:phosphoglycolate phosphatase-like HAD superfamily hydrolase